jgi:hypothetical protein
MYKLYDFTDKDKPGFEADLDDQIRLICNVLYNRREVYINQNITNGDGTVFGGSFLQFRHAVTADDRWYYGGMVHQSTVTSIAFTQDIIRAVPFYDPTGGTLDRLGILLGTGVATRTLRLAIYDSVSQRNLTPNNLIVDSGPLSTAVAGVLSATISVTLDPSKLYWLAVVGERTFTLRSAGVETWCPLGTSNTVVANHMGWQAAYPYAAFPATFPTPTVSITTMPMPAVRFSS